MLEVNGKITLSDDSLYELKDELRKEIIDNIERQGFTDDEIIKILGDYSYETYYHILKNSLSIILSKQNSNKRTGGYKPLNDLQFAYQKDTLRMLNLINELFDIVKL